jgi:hypothetical protein
MKRNTEFPGNPLPYIPPPPPNTHKHLLPVVLNRLDGVAQDFEAIHAINEAIRVCRHSAKAAREEAYAAGADGRVQHEAASEAYVSALPDIDNIFAVRAFIAAVAAGVKRGYIAGPHARLLLYTAQLQLSAMRKRVQ